MVGVAADPTSAATLVIGVTLTGGGLASARANSLGISMPLAGGSKGPVNTFHMGIDRHLVDWENVITTIRPQFGDRAGPIM
jgi:hypothetical protein